MKSIRWNLLQSICSVMVGAIIAICLGGTALAQTPNKAATKAEPGKGTVEHIKVHGKSLEGNLEGDSPDRDVFVYLPPSYAANKSKRYPVAYLLHGYGLTADRWMPFTAMQETSDKLIASGAMKEMILVNPDAFTKYSGSMYSSSATIGDWETFIAEDLVSYIDGHYRTIPNRMSRGLGGHSMGGYGTIRIGMKRPDVFSSMYIMSACCLSNNPGGQRQGQGARGDAAAAGNRGAGNRGAAPAVGVPAAVAAGISTVSPAGTNAQGAPGAATPGAVAPAAATPGATVAPASNLNATNRGAAGGRGQGGQGGRGGRGGRGFNTQAAEAAAWSANPKNPPDYYDLPVKDGQPVPAVVAKWQANSPLAMVDQYVTNLKKYHAIMGDVGTQDGLAGQNRQLDQFMTDWNVTHVFETYEGDHTNRVKERFEQKVLPFFSNNLASTKAKK